LVSVHPPMTPIAVSALMARPRSSRVMSRSSRVRLTNCAMRSMAQSQGLSSHWRLPAARYLTCVSRRSFMRFAALGATTCVAGAASAADDKLLQQLIDQNQSGSFGLGFDSASRTITMPKASLPTLSPSSAQTTEQAIGRYEGIVSRGGWAAVPPVERLRLGNRNPSVRALRQRLILSVAEWGLSDASFAAYDGAQLVAVMPLQIQAANKRVASSGWGLAGPALAPSLAGPRRAAVLSAMLERAGQVARDLGAATIEVGRSRRRRSRWRCSDSVTRASSAKAPRSLCRLRVPSVRNCSSYVRHSSTGAKGGGHLSVRGASNGEPDTPHGR